MAAKSSCKGRSGGPYFFPFFPFAAAAGAALGAAAAPPPLAACSSWPSRRNPPNLDISFCANETERGGKSSCVQKQVPQGPAYQAAQQAAAVCIQLDATAMSASCVAAETSPLAALATSLLGSQLGGSGRAGRSRQQHACMRSSSSDRPAASPVYTGFVVVSCKL